MFWECEKLDEEWMLSAIDDETFLFKIHLNSYKIATNILKKSHSICWQCQWTQSHWQESEEKNWQHFHFTLSHFTWSSSLSLLTFLSKFSCFGSEEFFSLKFLALFQFKIQPLPKESSLFRYLHRAQEWIKKWDEKWKQRRAVWSVLNLILLEKI